MDNTGRNRNLSPGHGAGPSGFCICPECGTEISHERGVPCVEKNCPHCGAKMIRKD